MLAGKIVSKRFISHIGIFLMLSVLAVNCDSGSSLEFSEDSGTYNHDIKVELSLGSDSTFSCSESDEDIYYTTDGSYPDFSSPIYSGSIPVSGDGTSMTITAATLDSNGDMTDWDSNYYIIDYSYTGGASNETNVDGSGTTARFNRPGMITYDGSGSLYVADTLNYTIRKILISNAKVSTVAGSVNFSISDDGTGTNAHFQSPTGICASGTTLFVTDSQIIRKINTTGYSTTTVAGSFSGYADNASALSAKFSAICGAVFSGDTLFIADPYNYCIRKYSVSSGVSTLAGDYSSRGHNDGTGTSAWFDTPSGLATDGTNIYVTDNTYIRSVAISSGTVTTLAGSSSTGAANGINTNALFNSPAGITCIAGDLYIADTNNHAIRKLNISTKNVSTIAGSFTYTGYSDGTGSNAYFNKPYGICTDGTYLYVSDKGNNNIRKIEISTGNVTTLAGYTE